jgi:hypothetical protein
MGSRARTPITKRLGGPPAPEPNFETWAAEEVGPTRKRSAQGNAMTFDRASATFSLGDRQEESYPQAKSHDIGGDGQ